MKQTKKALGVGACVVLGFLLVLVWPQKSLVPMGVLKNTGDLSVSCGVNKDGADKLAATESSLTESSSLLIAVEALMGSDSPESPHPVESAVARGQVLDSRVERVSGGDEWIRTRLARTPVQPDLVRVVETWKVDLAGKTATCLSRYMFVADQIIVKAADGLDELLFRQKMEEEGMTVEQEIVDALYTVRLKASGIDSVPEAINYLAGRPELAKTADPNGIGFGAGIPNDYLFAEGQWALNNTGQLAEDEVTVGIPGIDVDALEFWDTIGNPTSIVIAVLDTGINFSNSDFTGAIAINPGEIAGDGIDNDGNGKIDDYRGWDFVNSDNNPSDDHGHGSNVSGIIGAVRNNNYGVAGLLSGAKILPVKVLNSGNSGTGANLLAGITYARNRGVPVMNLSLGGYSYWAPIATELTACQNAGITLCIAAGNLGQNNDVYPYYPASYPNSNIIVVGNHDRRGGRYALSSYGLTEVDLFAPGTEIWAPSKGTDYFEWYSGTSQATPFVAAVAGAIKYANPSWTATQIKNSIMNSVVTAPEFTGYCVTGGRLNAANALADAIRQNPNQDSDGDNYSNLFEYLANTLIDNAQTSKPAVFFDYTAGYLRIGVPSTTRSGASFIVEKSTDMKSWTTTGVTDFSSAGTLLKGISYSSGPTGFLRIRAVTVP